MTLLYHPGVVFLAILCKRWDTGLALHGGGMAKSQTVNGFLFGVLTQQFYSYWISGVFVAGQRYQGRLPGSRFQGPGMCQVS